MTRQAVRTGLHAGVLLAVTGVVAWVTGTPFVFPSLGPTAYLLASQRTRNRGRLGRVVAGHVVAVLVLVAAHVATTRVTAGAVSRERESGSASGD